MSTSTSAVKRVRGAPKRARAARWDASVLDNAEQYQLRRGALIRAAARTFGHRGFHNVSLDDVAQSLNVTKPALYYYVKNKNELLYECLNQVLDLGMPALEYARTNGRSGLDKLSLFFTHYISRLTDEIGAFGILTEGHALEAGDLKRIQKRRREYDSALRALVEEGVADGSIAPCDSKMAVFFCMGAVNGISRWFSPDGSLGGVEVAQIFVSYITKLLTPGKKR